MPKPPHILLASSNANKLEFNLSILLDAAGRAAIRAAIDENVRALFQLGEEHLAFAKRLGKKRDWRQRVSRLYYAAFAISRSLRLAADGTYSAEVSDHQKLNALPEEMESRERYANQLPLLRDDRNLCDYDHVATIADLVHSPVEALLLVEGFRDHARECLAGRGITV